MYLNLLYCNIDVFYSCKTTQGLPSRRYQFYVQITSRPQNTEVLCCVMRWDLVKQVCSLFLFIFIDFYSSVQVLKVIEKIVLEVESNSQTEPTMSLIITPYPNVGFQWIEALGQWDVNLVGFDASKRTVWTFA